MTRRVTAKTWIRKNRGSEPDVHELLERVSEQVNTSELLQNRAQQALDALREFDEIMDALGWRE